TFLDIQNGFYNALCQGLGLSGSTFQILQPSPPLLPGDNHFLWTYFNNIPPRSLTQNYIASGGNQFFTDYNSLISALPAPPNTFARDVGSVVVKQWEDFLAGLTTIPSANQLPNMFLNWAIIHHPGVANIGAQDLSELLLDPISSAGLSLMPYTS